MEKLYTTSLHYLQIVITFINITVFHVVLVRYMTPVADIGPPYGHILVDITNSTSSPIQIGIPNPLAPFMHNPNPICISSFLQFSYSTLQSTKFILIAVHQLAIPIL